MSNKYNNHEDVPNSVLGDRLCQLADIISHGDMKTTSEFTMRVPAEQDRDADLVMTTAAVRLLEIDPLKEKVKRLEAEIDAVWNNCKVVLYRADGLYPFEHNPNANKDMKVYILSALKPLTEG